MEVLEGWDHSCSAGVPSSAWRLGVCDCHHLILVMPVKKKVKKVAASMHSWGAVMYIMCVFWRMPGG